MIPYDDLVVALAAWRARQGLPVVQVAGIAPNAARTSPTAVRPPPPHAPPRSAAPPPELAPELQDFEADALVEDSYDPAGGDYVVPLGGGMLIDQAGESTAIGTAPEVVTEGLLVPKRGKRNPDW
jgi:hypothetical protein